MDKDVKDKGINSDIFCTVNMENSVSFFIKNGNLIVNAS